MIPEFFSIATCFVLWGIFASIDLGIRSYLRKKEREKLELCGRVVDLQNLDPSSDGLIIVNRSMQMWQGLKLWWLPGQKSTDDNFLENWESSGQLLMDQSVAPDVLGELGFEVTFFDKMF